VPKLLAFVLPLALDSFAVAAAIGATQFITARQRLRISFLFLIFGPPREIWRPLLAEYGYATSASCWL
jgi:hypothetical protein